MFSLRCLEQPAINIANNWLLQNLHYLYLISMWSSSEFSLIQSFTRASNSGVSMLLASPTFPLRNKWFFSVWLNCNSCSRLFRALKLVSSIMLLEKYIIFRFLDLIIQHFMASIFKKIQYCTLMFYLHVFISPMFCNIT